MQLKQDHTDTINKPHNVCYICTIKKREKSYGAHAKILGEPFMAHLETITSGVALNFFFH